MKRFKFLSGDNSRQEFEDLMDMLHSIDHLPVLGIDEIVGPVRTGLLHDYHDNGLNPAGYQPYKCENTNGEEFSSDISRKSKHDWDQLYAEDDGYTYILYAVYRPDDEEVEAHVIELDGVINIFPLFVINNPDEGYLFEFIKIPLS
jgi:hypothetical protein